MDALARRAPRAPRPGPALTGSSCSPSRPGAPPVRPGHGARPPAAGRPGRSARRRGWPCPPRRSPASPPPMRDPTARRPFRPTVLPAATATAPTRRAAAPPLSRRPPACWVWRGPRTRPSATLDRRRPAGRAPPAAAGRADRWNAASPYGLPWLVARLRAPGGCPWDREQDHPDAAAVPAGGGVRGLRRAGGGLDAATSPRSWVTCCSRSCCTRSTAPRRASSTSPTCSGRIMTKIVRRHPHVFGDVVAAHGRRGDPQLGAHQGRRACRRGRVPRQPPAASLRDADGHAGRLRRAVAVAAGARLRRRDAGARRQPRLRLARPRGRHRQDRRGGR